MRSSAQLRTCVLVIAGVATAGGGLVTGTYHAAAATPGSPLSTAVITLFSEDGDPLAGGSQQEFDASNATITGTVAGSELSITASGGTAGNTFSFDIAPPRGRSLAAGEYTNVEQTSGRQSGHPGLEITSLYASCTKDTGSFEVREIVYAGKAIRSLDLLYEQHCDGSIPALFGEIRFGTPLANSVFVASQSITWPDITPGEVSGTQVLVPVRNLTAAAVQVGSVTISGSDPSSFFDGNDQCSGEVLAPVTGWCYVSIGFTPARAGPQTAVVNLPLGSRTEYVQLDGTTSGDQFRLAMASAKGDYVGQGQKYLFTTATATMTLWGGPAGLDIEVNGGVSNGWTLDLFPASGTVLKPGVFANATRWPFNGSGNGLSIYGQSRGCNTVAGSFSVQHAVFSAVDNAPEQFAATFIQHCEGAAPALKGTLSYGVDVKLPPSITNLEAVSTALGTHLTWTTPQPGSVYTVVRVQPAGARDPAPFSGTAVYSGTGTAAVIDRLVKGSRYLISAFTVDAYGDVSAPATLTITAA